MKTVKDILAAKGRDIWAVHPDALVYDAIKVMADKYIGALLVMDGDKLAGILSERDYARKVILLGRSSHQTPVRDIMTTRVICARPNQTTEDCMVLMTNNRIRHLPIMENGRVIGMLSIGDLVKTTIAEQRLLIEQLESYIRGA